MFIIKTIVMKNVIRSCTALVVAFAVMIVFQGCLKDKTRETYTIYTPVFKTLSQVRADMKSGPAKPLQNIGKLNVFGNYIFLNEVGRGIHVIDNTNPAAPRNISFINIPHNVDLAVRGSYLYADCYSDIAVFDISQPTNVVPVKFMNNVIKEQNRYWYGINNPDLIQVVVDYIAKDTTVDYHEYRQWQQCASCAVPTTDLKTFYTAVPQVGVGGSMARFTIVNDYLYTVSNSSLYSIALSNSADPQLTATKQMGWNIETIYPFQNKLFIGSSSGMFIYSLANPAEPSQLSRFTHATSCDPVIADEQYAYVTLRTGTSCNGTLNQMDILDISNLSAPVLRKTIPMTNPYGLAKDGDKLLVCDGKEGLRLYDASVPTSPQLIKQFSGLEGYDVIALNGKAIVVAKDGLYQFAYSNANNMIQLSKLPIETRN
jgi:hypothetical protein